MKTLYSFFIIFTLFLVGCGVKPNEVSAPEASENTVFPETYPQSE